MERTVRFRGSLLPYCNIHSQGRPARMPARDGKGTIYFQISQAFL